MKHHATVSSITLLTAAASLAILRPATGQTKPTLPPSEYDRWENLGARALSPDGRWLAYEINRVDETQELRIRPLDRDTTRVIAQGDGPVFAASSRWVAWTIALTPDERERLRKADEPVRLKAGLLDLESGVTRTFDEVQRLSFDPTGRYLALHGYAPEEPKGKGADLRVLDLGAGREVTFGNAGEAVWSEAGARLAMTIATGATGADRGNGVQLYTPATGRLSSLDASPSAYHHLVWREEGADLAVLRSDAAAGEEGSTYHLLAWRGLDGNDPEHLRLDLSSTDVPDTLEVVEHRAPEWSDDGTRIAFGMRPVSEKQDETASDSTRPRGDSVVQEESDDEPDLPALQIWHTADVRLVPAQQSRATADSRRTLLAVWDVRSNRVVQIGTDLMENATILEGWRHGTERVSAPYPWGAKFGRPYHDLWVTDLNTGARDRVLEEVRYSWPSAAGRYLLTFDGTDYWSVDLRTRERTNLTASLPTVFADTAYDTPTDVLPPHGVGGWIAGDQAVLLYDEFDVWRIALDGSSSDRLTDGAAEQIIHRVVDPTADRDAWDPDDPIYLSLRGEWSEQRGFARLRTGRSLERLVLDDRRFLSLRRADSADVFVYQAEARDDSPDLYTTGPDLASPRRLTETNPFMTDYAWTRAELVEYRSESGRRLQGALLYPANHDPSRRYPMIVYTYELLSPQIHNWERPSERDYYNFVAWTQADYFVLLPDIVYRAREPGVSAVEAVRPAVQAVVTMGLADPDRVGLIGHSWGGYQATYLPTRTKLFAASVAGAPLTDFVSFMGAIHWNPGIAELSHWETGQARMEVPYWEDPEAHHRNSPVHAVHEMDTPLLMAFGDDDGVVDWDQGTEFYNFARRAGKQMVLLVYEGEDHGFRTKANQIDYHRRILEWFGHYLKGEPAPSWITEGVPLDRMEDEKRRVAQADGTTVTANGHARPRSHQP